MLPPLLALPFFPSYLPSPPRFLTVPRPARPCFRPLPTTCCLFPRAPPLLRLSPSRLPFRPSLAPPPRLSAIAGHFPLPFRPLPWRWLPCPSLLGPLFAFPGSPSVAPVCALGPLCLSATFRLGRAAPARALPRTPPSFPLRAPFAPFLPLARPLASVRPPPSFSSRLYPAAPSPAGASRPPPPSFSFSSGARFCPTSGGPLSRSPPPAPFALPFPPSRLPLLLVGSCLPLGACFSFAVPWHVLVPLVLGASSPVHWVRSLPPPCSAVLTLPPPFVQVPRRVRLPSLRRRAFRPCPRGFCLALWRPALRGGLLGLGRPARPLCCPGVRVVLALAAPLSPCGLGSPLAFWVYFVALPPFFFRASVSVLCPFALFCASAFLCPPSLLPLPPVSLFVVSRFAPPLSSFLPALLPSACAFRPAGGAPLRLVSAPLPPLSAPPSAWLSPPSRACPLPLCPALRRPLCVLAGCVCGRQCCVARALAAWASLFFVSAPRLRPSSLAFAPALGSGGLPCLRPLLVRFRCFFCVAFSALPPLPLLSRFRFVRPPPSLPPPPRASPFRPPAPLPPRLVPPPPPSASSAASAPSLSYPPLLPAGLSPRLASPPLFLPPRPRSPLPLPCFRFPALSSLSLGWASRPLFLRAFPGLFPSPPLPSAGRPFPSPLSPLVSRSRLGCLPVSLPAPPPPSCFPFLSPSRCPSFLSVFSPRPVPRVLRPSSLCALLAWLPPRRVGPAVPCAVPLALRLARLWRSLVLAGCSFWPRVHPFLAAS